MTKRKWYSGPPPSVGWWPASIGRDKDVLRWWNGEFWSLPVWVGCTKQFAAHAAQIKALNSSVIEWTESPDSWPAWSKT